MPRACCTATVILLAVKVSVQEMVGRTMRATSLDRPRAMALAALLLVTTPATAQEFRIPNEAGLAALSQEQKTAMERQMTTEALAWPASVFHEQMIQPDIMEELSPARDGIVRGVDELHRASGVALMFQVEAGAGLLRLEDFATVRGPGLRVYLARAHTPATPDELGADFLDLGPLKAETGDHNYLFEGRAADYRSVVIYSQPFDVIFAVAPLQ